MIAPLWDDFHPSYGNDGRVYYQVWSLTYHREFHNMRICIFAERFLNKNVSVMKHCYCDTV